MSNERWRSLSRRQLRLHGEWLRTHDSSEETGESFTLYFKIEVVNVKTRNELILLTDQNHKTDSSLRFSPPWLSEKADSWTYDAASSTGQWVLCCCLLYLGLKKWIGLLTTPFTLNHLSRHLPGYCVEWPTFVNWDMQMNSCFNSLGLSTCFAHFVKSDSSISPVFLLKTKNLFRFRNLNYHLGFPTPKVTLLLSCFQAVFLPLQYHKY